MAEQHVIPFSRYLDDLRMRAHLSVRGLAITAGYRSGSGVQRYLEDPNIEEIRPEVARRLAQALFGKGEPPIMAADLGRLVGLEREDVEKLSPQAIRQILGVELETPKLPAYLAYPSEYGGVRLAGCASAATWMENAPNIDSADHYIDLPFARFVEIEGMYALKVLGDSINQVAPDGYYAICIKFEEKQKDLSHKRFYHIERRKSGLVEWSIKEAKWSDGIVTLWPSSHSNRFQEPLTPEGADDDVRILGYVIGWAGYA